MDVSQVVQQGNDLFEELHKLHVKFYELWSSNVFLTWRWFIGVGLIFVPWIIWFIIKKKQSTDRLLYAGFSVMLMYSFLDIIGIALGLWSYPFNVIPLMPEFIPFDISMAPVVTMVLIQIFPKVKPIYKALFYAAVGSFVFQPVMHFIDLYDPQGWQNYYSFPLLAGIYMAANFFATRTRFENLK